MHKGFADLSLTTWVRRHSARTRETASHLVPAPSCVDSFKQIKPRHLVGLGAAGPLYRGSVFFRNFRCDYRTPPAPKGRAGNGIRTRDINLGKVALYQLSYSRIGRTNITKAPSNCKSGFRPNAALENIRRTGEKVNTPGKYFSPESYRNRSFSLRFHPLSQMCSVTSSLVLPLHPERHQEPRIL